MKNARALLVAGLLVLAGCGGSSEASDTTLSQLDQYKEAVVEDQSASGDSQPGTTETTTRPEVTIPDEFDQPEDEILATYAAYHEALLEASGFPEADPDYQPFYELLTEPQTSIERRELERLQSEGSVVVQPDGRTTHSVRFFGAFNPEKTEGNSVILLDCNVDALEVRDLENNVLNDEVATFVLAVELKVVEGAWRVAAIDVKERYEGVSECEEYANL